MANVNFFSRISNLFSGFLSLFIADIESKHPEIAYENAINGMTEKYSRLKSATAAIIRRRDELRYRMDEEQRRQQSINRDLEAALDMDDAELGALLIQKKEAVDASIADLAHDQERAESEADDAKSALMNIKGEIQKLKDEKDRMLAKIQSADARIKIQEQLDGLSVDAEVQSLDNVRKHIKDRVAEADLGKEMATSDLDHRLGELRKTSSKLSAKKKFEALKQKKTSVQSSSERTI